MSITVTELFSRSSTQDSQWKRTYKRTFLIVTTDPTIGAQAVREALPATVGNTYYSRGEFDLGSYCNNISVDCDSNDGKGWTGTAEYGPYDPNVAPPNPIERPLKVSWGFVARERVLAVDADGIAVRNSAGDPFDPPTTVDEYYPVLTITRCEMANDPALNYLYRSATNSDVFLGSDPGTVRCFPIESELTRDQDIGWYYVKTYRFEFDKDGWNKPILDQGLRKKVSGVVSPILSKGVAITEPYLLNGTGGENPVAADPVFLPFKRFAELPFDVFNLTLDMIPTNI